MNSIGDRMVEYRARERINQLAPNSFDGERVRTALHNSTSRLRILHRLIFLRIRRYSS